MSKILLGIKNKSVSYSSNDSDGYSCGTIETTQVDIVMSGTESEVREFVNKAKENRKKLSNISDEIDQLIEIENWSELDKLNITYDNLIQSTKGINYDKFIMVDGVEL